MPLIPICKQEGRVQTRARYDQHVWSCTRWDLVKFMQFVNVTFLLRERDSVEQLRQCVDQDKSEVGEGSLSFTQMNLHIFPNGGAAAAQ